MGKDEKDTTIEDEFAKLMGLEGVSFTKDDRKEVAKGLVDLIVIGSCHLIMKPKGVKRLDPKHVKIKLD